MKQPPFRRLGYSGIYRKWVPDIIDGFQRGLSPTAIARNMWAAGSRDYYGAQPSNTIVRYILEREGWLPSAHNERRVTKSTARQEWTPEAQAKEIAAEYRGFSTVTLYA